jgi:hypothetical protein
VSWVSTAGLSLRIEPDPDSLSRAVTATTDPVSGKIYLHKVNWSRIPLHLIYSKVDSSVSGVAKVSRHTHRTSWRITVPGRASKYTSAKTPGMKDEIAIWTAGQIAGTATITAEFRVSTAVATMGLLVPACDVTTK